MYVVTLANEKGGTGKTTVAITLAAGLAIRGLRVVVIDADGQGDATFALGLKKEPGFYDLLVRDAAWKSVLKVLKPDVYAPDDAILNDGLLGIVVGNEETQLISQRMDEPFLLAERLTEIESWCDVVIVDTSPTPSLLHGAIYLATDALLFPTECEAYSVKGLQATIRHMQGFRRQRQANGGSDIGIAGILPVKYRAQTVEHSVNLDLLKQKYPDLVWLPVGDRIAWPESAKDRRPIFATHPNTPATAEAWRIVDHMMEVLGYVKA